MYMIVVMIAFTLATMVGPVAAHPHFPIRRQDATADKPPIQHTFDNPLPTGLQPPFIPTDLPATNTATTPALMAPPGPTPTVSSTAGATADPEHDTAKILTHLLEWLFRGVERPVDSLDSATGTVGRRDVPPAPSPYHHPDAVSRDYL